MVYYFDMDGVIANFHKTPYNRANAMSRSWIANLDPFMNNIALMKRLMAYGDTVYVLTLAASDNARLGKIDFLKKYIPEFDTDNNFICIVGNGNKADYIREEGTLIDDGEKNIKQWVKAGHPAIFVEHKGDDVIIA